MNANFNIAFVVAVVAMIVSVHGQGRVYYPIPLAGNSNVAGYGNGLDSCGLSTAQNSLYTSGQQAPSLQMTPGQQVTLPYVANGQAGFGPLYVRFDQTNSGQSFNTMATMNSNIPGVSGYLSQSPSGTFPYYTNITFTVPSTLNCPNNVCLMQVVNAQAYVSCMFVRIGSGNVPTPVTPGVIGYQGSGASLYGGVQVQDKLIRVELLTNIIKNLGADPKILFQQNYNVNNLVNSLVSVIN